ncbi:hypothetical protein [Cylindrospermopsis raciborskii]|uniref:hypothetical protein n=1 Tax=Cylindrospermopsis raciborskii TaxID=77022 RepID=UPI00067FA4FF|nr:hypothetical protein [Cylindrospermopsis raciborskii]
MRSHVPIFPIGSAVLTGDSKPNGRSRSTPYGRSHHTDYHSNIHLSTVCFNQMLKGFCQKYRPQPKKVEKNRWGSKLLAGMKPNQKKKGTSPGQLKLFWDELDITNEEIIKAATIFVKANCYTPNPKNK